MKREPQRTCIACRGSFDKHDVVRIVAGPEGIVTDSREKLPGRGAYVCPRRECIQKALGRDNLPRALHRPGITIPRVEDFIRQLTSAVTERIKSLVSMAAKAGKLAAGYSAVRDGLEKQAIFMLIFARDISAGTMEKILADADLRIRRETLLTKDEIGAMLGREEVGVIGIQDRGFAESIGREFDRLKSLINNNE